MDTIQYHYYITNGISICVYIWALDQNLNDLKLNVEIPLFFIIS